MAKLFSQLLENLLDPLPTFADPEDDAGEATRARVTEHFNEDQEVDVGNIRRALTLHETDTRYEGRKVSRRQLLEEEEEQNPNVGDNEEDVGGDEEEEDEDVRNDEEEEDEDGGYEEEEDGDVGGDEEEDGDVGGDKEEDGDDGEEVVRVSSSGADSLDYQRMTEELDDLVVAESEGDAGLPSATIQTFSQARLEEEVGKGEAVRDQLALCDRLLETRIKIQKVLVAANQLPTPQTLPEFQKRGGSELAAALAGSHTALAALQTSLLELHALLLQHLPQDHMPLPTTDLPGISEIPTGYPAYMACRFAAFGPFWNTTLQKWHEATRLAVGRGGFGAFHRSILVQMEEVLTDRERLLRRTRTRRSDYRVLGVPEEVVPVQVDEDIFDDDDFYHQLLRELIQRRTGTPGHGDQLSMGRQWLAIQRLRSKMKRKVDTKASKGRRVRFQVHSKLAHFMAPVECGQMSEEARRELYRCLFAQRPI